MSIRHERLRVGLFSDVVVPTPPAGWGGIEEMLRHLASGLVKEGSCEVYLFASEDSHAPDGATLVPLTPSVRAVTEGKALDCHLGEVIATQRSRSQRLVCRWCSEHRLDVAHFHPQGVWTALASCMAAGGTAVVQTVHNAMTSMAQAEYTDATELALVGIAAHQTLAAPHLPWVGVCHNGINPDDYTPPRFEKVGDPNEVVFGFIGRVCPEKFGPALDVFLGVSERLASQGRRAKLVVAGPVFPPDNAGWFNSEIAPLVDGDRVRYLGEIKTIAEKDAFFKSLDVQLFLTADWFDKRTGAVLRSWREGFGMVSVEGWLANGVPLLAYDDGGPGETTQDGINGFKVPLPRPYCHAEVVEAGVEAALRCLAEIDRREAYQYALEHFTDRAMARRYLGIYRGLRRGATGRMPMLVTLP
jgi:glycosyltransferase involved in cell wall biosynthesis